MPENNGVRTQPSRGTESPVTATGPHLVLKGKHAPACPAAAAGEASLVSGGCAVGSGRLRCLDCWTPSPSSLRWRSPQGGGQGLLLCSGPGREPGRTVGLRGVGGTGGRPGLSGVVTQGEPALCGKPWGSAPSNGSSTSDQARPDARTPRGAFASQESASAEPGLPWGEGRAGGGGQGVSEATHPGLES